MLDATKFEYVGVSYGENEETYQRLIELMSVTKDQRVKDYICELISCFPVTHIVKLRGREYYPKGAKA